MFKSFARSLVTLVFVLVAAVVVWNLWLYYEEAPRTRDGRVSADTIVVAADVAGRVVEVPVKDNARVAKGDVLFRIDPVRYRIAVRQAQAAADKAEAVLVQAKRDAARLAQLDNAVASTQQREQANTSAAQAAAAYEQAAADLALAQTNLDRTTVTSPVDGLVTNLELRAGDYVSAGSPATAVVDSDSFYVVGYFEETKLSGIREGDVARIDVMGEDETLTGRVSGISAAIADRSESVGSSLLSNVDPSFTWVRLAQRVPVRVALDARPETFRLVAGRTASVDLTQPGESPDWSEPFQDAAAFLKRQFASLSGEADS